MPVKWDLQARNALLLMIVSRNMTTLIGVDAKSIAAEWPFEGDLTERAVQEQVRVFRKQCTSANYVLPGNTSFTGARGSASKTSTPRKTPATPIRIPTKRAAPNGNDTPTSSAKKRKTNKNSAKGSGDLESDTPIISSEEEAAESVESSSDDALANVPVTSVRRTLPTRSVSRSKPYLQDNGSSSSEDAGARDPNSDEDGEFDLEAEAKTEVAKSKKTMSPSKRFRALLDGAVDGEGEGPNVQGGENNIVGKFKGTGKSDGPGNSTTGLDNHEYGAVNGGGPASIFGPFVNTKDEDTDTDSNGKRYSWQTAADEIEI